MRKLKLTLLSISILGFSLVQATTGKGIDFQHLTLEQAKQVAQKENKLIFIDLYATWCGPCKYLTKSVFVDEELGDFFNENFISLKLDGEKTDGRVLMSKFELNSYPTLLFINHKGELIKKQVGASGPQAIKQFGQDALHPEETKIFKFRSRHKNGETSKDFLAEYLMVLFDEGDEDEISNVAEAYLEKYSDIELTNKSDFIAFAFCETVLSDQLAVSFLSNIKALKSIHGDELVQTKIFRLITSEIVRAADLKDEKIIKTLLDQIYKPYKIAIGEGALTESEFSEKVNEIFKNNLS